MKNQDYQDFFIEFAKFKNKRLEERKRRGINEYNPLLVVQKAHLEVQMHSNMLCSLLNPNGNHAQGDLFLKEFLKQCNIDESNFEDLKIYTEFNIESGRLDLYLKAKNFHIVIENKIYAKEQEVQLDRYANFLDSLDSQNGEKYLIYLTPYGNEPSSLESWKIIENTIKKGDKELHYRQISYEKDILKWCENIKEKVKNIANLYYAIEFYTDAVKEITNQKENQMEIIEFLKEKNSSDTYSLALEILQQEDKILEMIANFLKQICKDLLKEERFKDWEVIKINDEDSAKYLSFALKPKQTNDYYFAFVYQDINNVYRSFGIRYLKNGTNGIQDAYNETPQIFNDLKKEFVELRSSKNLIEDTQKLIRNHYEKLLEANKKLNQCS
ncbi:PD-(D/E)XK nuclease family protein [Helicobacter burdigaliensis]|uniref:PDDEXK-like family protein n=1 Tax=Helicobacter burdigaliensis TaxID=2315334 RepID=UPI000EF751CC|nr:PD-(D/E)XK nuclease family protein [Helicobacter burdigaliensis]